MKVRTCKSFFLCRFIGLSASYNAYNFFMFFLSFLNLVLQLGNSVKRAGQIDASANSLIFAHLWGSLAFVFLARIIINRFQYNFLMTTPVAKPFFTKKICLLIGFVNLLVFGAFWLFILYYCSKGKEPFRLSLVIAAHYLFLIWILISMPFLASRVIKNEVFVAGFLDVANKKCNFSLLALITASFIPALLLRLFGRFFEKWAGLLTGQGLLTAFLIGIVILLIFWPVNYLLFCREYKKR